MCYKQLVFGATRNVLKVLRNQYFHEMKSIGNLTSICYNFSVENLGVNLLGYWVLAR